MKPLSDRIAELQSDMRDCDEIPAWGLALVSLVLELTKEHAGIPEEHVRRPTDYAKLVKYRDSFIRSLEKTPFSEPLLRKAISDRIAEMDTELYKLDMEDEEC